VRTDVCVATEARVREAATLTAGASTSVRSGAGLTLVSVGAPPRIILDPDRFEALLGDAEDSAPEVEERSWPVTDVFVRSGFPDPTQGSPGEGPGHVYSVASWSFTGGPPLRPPRVLALERLNLVHLSRSSFLHSGASMCVWHHSATACSTSERVMPRGLGSISSITLPEGGGELRVGNSRQAMKPRRTASWLESRCPVMRSSVLTISEQA
jgi:hypothetical protein